MEKHIQDSIQKSIDAKKTLLQDQTVIKSISESVAQLVKLFANDGAFYAAGNGGSASDSQHMVAELVGRFYYDRAPLRAYSLSTNISNITCIGNDYGYEEIFARQIDGCGRPGDIFFAISTSGNSKNVIKAAKQAKHKKMIVIGLTGDSGGILTEYCDLTIKVPSQDTARIQESHILICHIICELVEAQLFPKA